MKQTYETPKLIVHGTVEEMTNAIGPSATAMDHIFQGTNIIGSAPGSQDGYVTGF